MFCHIERKDEKIEKVEFKDSLKVPAASAPRVVEKILKNLGLVDRDWTCPRASNLGFQRGGWECGLWAARWVERTLREQRGEGRIAPPSIKFQTDRVNNFIQKLKDARTTRDEKAASEAKKAEGKAKAKARLRTSATKLLAEIVEPVFETLEDALEAAQKCKKCLPTKKGTKGCRTCMGEWFEEIRLRKTS